jgi:uncharacterized protein DUF1707
VFLCAEAAVMSQPGDQGGVAWAGYGRMLASRADRERVVDVLKTAFVQGRLTKDEFESGVGRALGSRTYAELAAITAGIPAGPAAVAGFRPTRQPERARKPTREAVAWSGSAAFMAFTLVAVLLFDPGYFAFVAGAMFSIVFAAGAQLLYARQQRRARGQLSA